MSTAWLRSLGGNASQFSPVDIGESKDLFSDEEYDLVRGYMDGPFHDWVCQSKRRGQDKAWWEVQPIVSGCYYRSTFVRRALDPMFSQDEPKGNNPPRYGDLFRGKACHGPMGHLERPPEPKRSATDTP